ncbi:MAG: hypothetical protein CBD39_02930 [Flavobacteriaceae bacterium TMED179]|nr:MAG: hypothetical protein CBD39_02930 [Flavobacteriaceae bacterium TMED179]|tara:strand:- start:70337 stop:70597 length:261 start_codon:yes stop_codon:yes gene_type:complete
MKLSIELTLTPLRQDYIPTIKSFILSLRSLDFIVKENPLSTQVYGDFDSVMQELIPLIRNTFQNEEAIILHLKMVKGDRSQYEPNF